MREINELSAKLLLRIYHQSRHQRYTEGGTAKAFRIAMESRQCSPGSAASLRLS
ncbi:MAG: hypothetical protein EBE86_027540 [Hormoscilla sp. GUM202]|nr:hypothetical protein [Hormoscilla sp. GUM202]MBO1350888.1 hypothetical protein [Hormoscilla sp. GUM202]